MSKRIGDSGYAAGWCIHYRHNRGVKKGEPNTCEAGVDYEAWRGIGHDKTPCFLDDKGQSKPNAVSCPKIRRPAAQEISDHEDWLKEQIKRVGVVMTGIAAWRKKHQGHSHAEIVECPACKGKLHLSIVGSNGHVHAHCETEGCASWIE
jgi:hypothetical protein